MSQLLYFLIAITVIVTVHELGHYLVAKFFRIKVEKFSIGFGSVLCSKKWNNTEWCVSLIPLGGYVRMLDTRNSEVALEDRAYAFDLQAPWKKILIYLAGPLVNLLLGTFLLGVVFYNEGITSIQPQINTIIFDSLADKAGFQEGDYVLKINNREVKNFLEVSMLTMENLEGGVLEYEVRDRHGQILVRKIGMEKYPGEIRKILLGKSSFGFSPYKMTNQLQKVIADSPASQAGLQAGDIILALNGQKITNFSDFSSIIRSHSGQQVSVLYQRGEKKSTTTVIPKSERIKGFQPVGRIGVQNKIDETLAKKNRDIYYPSILGSVKMAVSRTGDISRQIVIFLGKMLVGKSSLVNINGPITTAGYASEAAKMGFIPYLMFLALISISVGVLNLLPISVLDGGGALFSLIEWIRGKPMSETVQKFAMCFGLFLIVLLMFIAFSNDFVRIFG